VSPEGASVRGEIAAPVPAYRDGLRASAPIAATVWFFGAPVVRSATTFAGSAQFAVVSVLGTSGGAAAAIAAAVLLNGRYVPISISVASLFHGPRLRRLAEAQLIVDESWALSTRGDGRFHRGLLLGAGVLLYCAWVTGTVVGVLGGRALGNPKSLGLDGAFPALFLALLAPQLASTRARLAALLAGVIAFALIPLTPAGAPIVAASVACLLGLRLRRPASPTGSRP
jgi:predicted branched-subunit amino acid permease